MLHNALTDILVLMFLVIRVRNLSLSLTLAKHLPTFGEKSYYKDKANQGLPFFFLSKPAFKIFAHCVSVVA